MSIELVDLKRFCTQPVVLKIVCACLSGLIVYELINCIITDLNIRKIIAQPVVRNTSTAHHSITPISAKGHLFGIEKNLNDVNIASSFLKINLVGLVYSAVAKDSEVIIHNASGIDKIYHVGDLLSDGVRIESITPEGMLVMRDGNLERVLLPK